MKMGFVVNYFVYKEIGHALPKPVKAELIKILSFLDSRDSRKSIKEH